MYSIVYCKYGLPQVDLDFQTELEMENYVNIWIDGDEDYVDYFKNDVQYDPPWTR